MSEKNLLSFLRHPLNGSTQRVTRERDGVAAWPSVAAHRAGHHLWASTARAPLGSPSTIFVPLQQKQGPRRGRRSLPELSMSTMTHVRPGSTCPARPTPTVSSPLSFWTSDRSHYPHPHPSPPSRLILTIKPKGSTN